MEYVHNNNGRRFVEIKKESGWSLSMLWRIEQLSHRIPDPLLFGATYESA